MGYIWREFGLIKVPIQNTGYYLGNQKKKPIERKL